MSKAAIVMTVVAWVSCQAGPAEPNHPADATPIAVAPPEATEAPSARKCFDEPGMVYIPAEVRPRDRLGHRYQNRDRESVDVEPAPFWLDRLEVTVEEFRACVDAGACELPHLPDADLVCTWNIRGVRNLPINCVDGEDADAYCAWKRKRVPLGYEWTWAAQGRYEQRKYPWGDARPRCELTIAMDEDNEDGCDLGRPWPVGSRPRDVSRDGALDLGGNISEIVLDRMPDDPPFDGTHVEFGGSWRSPATNYNSLHDFAMILSYPDREGFRCAKDPGPLPPCLVAN